VPGHRFKARPKRQLGRDTELLDPLTLPGTITASGCQGLRIVVLYATAHTRRRIQSLLAYHFDRLDLAAAPISDGDETPLLGGAVTVIFCNASPLLAHGPHTQRRQLANAISHLDPSPGTRILALCETDYDPAAWEEQRKKARRGSSEPDPDIGDAKHPVNQLLARRGLPTQFIAATAAPRTGQVTQLTTAVALTEAVRKNHAGHSALGDLLRSGGIIHSRIGDALAHGRHGLTRPHAFIGLHLREQKAIAGMRHLIDTLTALIPVSETSQWRMLGYSWQPHPVTGTTGWMTYTEADVAFLAHDLAEGTRATAYDARVPAAINQALCQLKPALGDTPYLLFVSGESCRSIWPGLANKHLDRAPDPDGTIEDRTPLPGPPGFKPAAIVRITPGTGEVPPASPRRPHRPQPSRHQRGRRLRRGRQNHQRAIRTRPRTRQRQGMGTRHRATPVRRQRPATPPRQRHLPLARQPRPAASQLVRPHLNGDPRRRHHGRPTRLRHRSRPSLRPHHRLGRPDPLPSPPPRRTPDGQRPPRVPSHHRLRRRPP
jgi:hypothetical protein